MHCFLQEKKVIICVFCSFINKCKIFDCLYIDSTIILLLQWDRIINLQIKTHLTNLEIMASLIAAVTHDLDLPGVNQPFLVATSNHLAALYQVRTSLNYLSLFTLLNFLLNNSWKSENDFRIIFIILTFLILFTYWYIVCEIQSHFYHTVISTLTKCAAHISILTFRNVTYCDNWTHHLYYVEAPRTFWFTPLSFVWVSLCEFLETLFYIKKWRYF